ncbi:GNAT family protein [Luedemannella flava]|uniref:GNAT family protein n=1 Tax=Luedemannella flava TaxID=349316 RepID=A0ABN2MKU1_9ACTN
MFGSCRRTGLHIVRTPRLWIVSARDCDLPAYHAIHRDPAAQRWLGWPDELLQPAEPPRVDLPLRRRDGILRPTRDQLVFVAVDRATKKMAAGIGVTSAADGRHEIGGAVAAAFRGRGYGTEALRAVCDLAHRHFGIFWLRAGCEVDNVASIGWLRSAGFAPADGPATHTLPNGRVIESLWWGRGDPRARRRCPWL